MDFIHAYLEYCKSSETPQTYNLWCALSTLASVVNRRVWVDQGYFNVYPHMYTTLVGPPSGGKTASMEISQLMLEEVGDLNFAGTAMTKEALCVKLMKDCLKTQTTAKGLKEYTPMTLCLTELTHFLGANSAHMIDFLTTIFDKENYKSETKNMGNDIIPGPGLNILACTTQSNITRYLKEDVLSGGYSSRTNMIVSTDTRTPQPRPKISPEQHKAREWCISYLRELQGIYGEFKLTEAADAWYDAWYREYFAWLETQPDGVVKGYHERLMRVHIFKVGMMFSLSSSKELVLDRPHLELGLATLQRAAKHLERIYEGLGRNELAPIQTRLMEFITGSSMNGSYGAITEKDGIAYLTKDANYGERLEIIRTMIESGKIVKMEDTTTKRILLATPEWVRVRAKIPDRPKPTEPPPESDTGSAT